MAEQDYDKPQEEAGTSAEVNHYTGEPEFDEETLRSNERRSRFFFAAMSFLIALLFLSAYLNHLTALNDTILQLGIIESCQVIEISAQEKQGYKKAHGGKEKAGTPLIRAESLFIELRLAGVMIDFG